MPVNPLGVLLAIDVHASGPPLGSWRVRNGLSHWLKEVVDLGMAQESIFVVWLLPVLRGIN